MKLVLLGSTPSKKNSKRLVAIQGRLRPISSQRYLDWEEEALWQLKGKPSVSSYPAAVTMVFHVKDNRGRDLDNMASSVLDVLQKASIIENDDWQHIRPLTLDCAGVDKEPRVEVFFD